MSICFDLYGCVQAAVTPSAAKDGTLPEGRWFDLNRLEVLNHKRVMPVPAFPVTMPDYGPAEKPSAGKRS